MPSTETRIAATNYVKGLNAGHYAVAVTDDGIPFEWHGPFNSFDVKHAARRVRHNTGAIVHSVRA